MKSGANNRDKYLRCVSLDGRVQSFRNDVSYLHPQIQLVPNRMVGEEEEEGGCQTIIHCEYPFELTGFTFIRICGRYAFRTPSSNPLSAT